MFGEAMRFLFITTAIAIVTLVGCAAQVERTRTTHSIERPCCQSVERAPSRRAIVQTAAKLVGAKTIESNGRRIAYDCAGVTRAVFLRHGIDLYGSSENDPEANGVRLIYAHIQQQGTFHQGPVAHPGDLIFFNDTWDYNGDGKANDPLTHVGIVERQESDGTVVFISRVAGAVERYHMNLDLPHVHRTVNGRVLNDYIRRKEAGDPADTGHLTGELFAIFGTRVGL
jgi:NlpC/P60 family